MARPRERQRWRVKRGELVAGREKVGEGADGRELEVGREEERKVHLFKLPTS